MHAQSCVMRRSRASFMMILILTFGLLPLVGAQAQKDTRRSKAAGASEVSQQTRKFAPGELLVGYKSEADRDKAAKALTAQRKKFILPGGKKAQRLTVAPMSGAAMKVRIKLPRSMRASAKKDPAVELKILQDTAKKLRQSDKRITYAHPNWIVTMKRAQDSNRPGKVQKRSVKKPEQRVSPTAVPQQGPPNDPYYLNGSHWNYGPAPGGMNAVGAWNYTRGEADIVVAVVSSGILYDHPDIEGSGNVLRGYSFDRDAGRGPDATDIDKAFAGTAAAGIIGAVGTDNGRLVAGLNWRVSILPVRAVDANLQFYMDDMGEAIRWSSGLPIEGIAPNENPADVINLGINMVGPCNSEENGSILEAINAARQNGSVIVIASGGEGDAIGEDIGNNFPANCPGVISVAAHDEVGRLAPYSYFGNVTIMAPGGLPGGASIMYPVGITDEWPEGVAAGNGTQFAAAHVSGAIALALSMHPEWRRNPDLIEQKLRASARPVTSAECPNPCGDGQLDAEQLVLDPQIAARKTLQEEKPFGGPPPSTIRRQEEKPFGGPPPSTIRRDERETTMAGPRGAKPAAGARSKDAQRSGATARAALNEPSSEGFDGQWQMADGGALEIEGSEWRHPAMGIADLSKGKGIANYEVQYRYQRGVICAYRIKKTSNGQRLILDPTDPTQPIDFCPSGALPKVGS